MVELEEKVDRLEALLGRFIINTDISLSRLERGLEAFKEESERDRKSLHEEMKEFKEEMREDRKKRDEEMKDFKNEMREDRKKRDEEMKEYWEKRDADMKDFKDEMKDFKDEMREDRKRQDEEIRKANQEAGALSKKFGTLVEDFVIPSLPKVIKEKFGFEIDDLQSRRKIKHPITKLSKEYDALTICGEYLFLNSTISKIKLSDIEGLIEEIKQFREYLPEYKNKKIIGILSTLYFDDDIIRYAEKNGFLTLGLGDWMMELKNSKDFKPKEY